jgi:3-hydroxyacyl-CoA dehydrogenase
VEVKIGVQRTPREIVLESTQTPEEVEAAVRDALKDPGGVLALVDEKGRKVVVPGALVAYVEIADADHRRVGFAVGS